MYPVPLISDLADFSGRPESSYTGFATAALAQATLMFSFRTEITDPSQFTGYNNLTPSDQQTLALQGICAMGDYIYLRQPYQQAVAGPFMSEHIGSYNYAKAPNEVARNAAALEVTGEATGVKMFDLAVEMLAIRSMAGGVFSGGVVVFEASRSRDDRSAIKLCYNQRTGRWSVLGPSDMREIDFQFFDINAENFPIDPGIG